MRVVSYGCSSREIADQGLLPANTFTPLSAKRLLSVQRLSPSEPKRTARAPPKPAAAAHSLDWDKVVPARKGTPVGVRVFTITTGSSFSTLASVCMRT